MIFKGYNVFYLYTQRLKTIILLDKWYTCYIYSENIRSTKLYLYSIFCFISLGSTKLKVFLGLLGLTWINEKSQITQWIVNHHLKLIHNVSASKVKFFCTNTLYIYIHLFRVGMCVQRLYSATFFWLKGQMVCNPRRYLRQMWIFDKAGTCFVNAHKSLCKRIAKSLQTCVIICMELKKTNSIQFYNF